MANPESHSQGSVQPVPPQAPGATGGGETPQGPQHPAPNQPMAPQFPGQPDPQQGAPQQVNPLVNQIPQTEVPMGQFPAGQTAQGIPQSQLPAAQFQAAQQPSSIPAGQFAPAPQQAGIQPANLQQQAPGGTVQPSTAQSQQQVSAQAQSSQVGQAPQNNNNNIAHHPQQSPGVQLSSAVAAAMQPATTAPTAQQHSQQAGRQAAQGNRPILAPVQTGVNGIPSLEEEEEADSLLNYAPAWLISAIIHMVALIIFGLWALSSVMEPEISLEVFWDETPGEMLDEGEFSIDTLEEIDINEKVVDPSVVIEKEMLVAGAKEVMSDMVIKEKSYEKIQVKVGGALAGRAANMKPLLLDIYGGGQETEDAVLDGLTWLARMQSRDGSWGLSGQNMRAANMVNPNENRLAATAMALLAFQGYGYTHFSTPPQLNPNQKNPPFHKNVAAGWRWLLSKQAAEGSFYKIGRAPQEHQLYTHAQITIALCELYGMTKDSKFRQPAQDAISYAVDIQSEEGGWRYIPGSESDLSVTGWFTMALQSANMAGLEVPDKTYKNISRYLDACVYDDGSRYSGSLYSYQPNRGWSRAMTAEGLLCRQYLGWPKDNRMLVEGVERLVSERNLPSWNERDSYYWYYATQVCHHMEGSVWRKWNSAMKPLLINSQIKSGIQKGSWEPRGDYWGSRAGRLYVTCMHIFMLEVYYRHLPIYRKELFGTESTFSLPE